MKFKGHPLRRVSTAKSCLSPFLFRVFRVPFEHPPQSQFEPVISPSDSGPFLTRGDLFSHPSGSRASVELRLLPIFEPKGTSRLSWLGSLRHGCLGRIYLRPAATNVKPLPCAHLRDCGGQKTFSAGPCSFRFQELWLAAFPRGFQPVSDSRHGRIAYQAFAPGAVLPGEPPPPISPEGSSNPFAGWRRRSQNHGLFLWASSGNIRCGS